jgi:hypothetical protein
VLELDGKWNRGVGRAGGGQAYRSNAGETIRQSRLDMTQIRFLGLGSVEEDCADAWVRTQEGFEIVRDHRGLHDIGVEAAGSRACL